MSCNICHTPILVHPNFLNPNRMDHVSQEDHLDPIVNQVCPITSHQAYFRNVAQIDRRFEGIVMQDVQHAGRGVFISNQWKIAGGTAQAVRQEEVNNQVTVACYNIAHEGCLKLLCARIDVPFNLKQDGRDTLIVLVERHEMLGTTAYGGYEGIDYSGGKLDKRWLSQPNGDEDGNVFVWKFENGEQDWTMKRPDMFPRLHITVKSERLAICDNPAASEDPLSESPDLVFLNIASHLGLSDLYNLAALSKQLRHRCLATSSYQNIVRTRLLANWAAPIPSEYPSVIPEGYPHLNATGDWLLYGYHVHKTDSMRNRRRIFDLTAQIEAQYQRKAVELGYTSGPTAEKKQSYLRAVVDQQLLLRKLNEMYDFELFIKSLTELNKAYAADLTKPKFAGNKLPRAVEKVRRMMEGKVGKEKHHPGSAWEQRILAKINERMQLIMLEKDRYSQRRVAPRPNQ